MKKLLIISTVVIITITLTNFLPLFSGCGCPGGRRRKTTFVTGDRFLPMARINSNSNFGFNGVYFYPTGGDTNIY